MKEELHEKYFPLRWYKLCYGQQTYIEFSHHSLSFVQYTQLDREVAWAALPSSPVILVQVLPLDEAQAYTCLTQANCVSLCSIGA